MHKHIVFTRPEDGGVSVVGLDYFNPSVVRFWTRPGKLRGVNGNPVFTLPDGGVLTLENGGLVHPDDDLLFADDGSPVCVESTANFVARVLARHVPAGVIHEVIDTRTFLWPSDNMDGDKYFKDAWRHVPGEKRVEVDMPKARILHMNNIRMSRDAELEALDVPFMRAVEAGDITEQQRIAAQKQVLRAIPQTFDLATYTTPEALRAAWPVQLPVQP